MIQHHSVLSGEEGSRCQDLGLERSQMGQPGALEREQGPAVGVGEPPLGCLDRSEGGTALGSRDKLTVHNVL